MCGVCGCVCVFFFVAPLLRLLRVIRRPNVKGARCGKQAGQRWEESVTLPVPWFGVSVERSITPSVRMICRPSVMGARHAGRCVMEQSITLSMPSVSQPTGFDRYRQSTNVPMPSVDRPTDAVGWSPALVPSVDRPTGTVRQ